MGSAFDVELAPGTVAAAQKGQNWALEAIYRGFERPVYSLVRRMCGDPDAAKDLMQDTFMRAFKCIAQYRGDAPFGHWLRRVAATEALMYLRRGRMVLDLFVRGDEMLEHVAVDDVSSLDLERSLALMPPVPRAVLWLYHVEGYTHPEIAQMAGKTVSFSKSQLSRAHQKLRELLEGGHGNPSAATEKTSCPPLTSTP